MMPDWAWGVVGPTVWWTVGLVTWWVLLRWHPEAASVFDLDVDDGAFEVTFTVLLLPVFVALVTAALAVGGIPYLIARHLQRRR